MTLCPPLHRVRANGEHATHEPPNNSLQLTRLACGKLERDLPAKWRENGATDARAAGQLPLASSGCCADPLRGRYAELEAVSRPIASHRQEGGSTCSRVYSAE